MRRKKGLTPLELQIMNTLWHHGPGTVQEVQDNMPGERLAYTTVQTMLNILEKKGRVKRTLIGKAYEYRPALTRDKAMREALGDIIEKMFGGSVESLVMTLIKNRQLDSAKLSKMQQLIENHRKASGEDHD